MIYRKLVLVILNCPVNKVISLEDCGKCPYYKGYEKWRNIVSCNKLSDKEEIMKEELTIIKEPKSKW